VDMADTPDAVPAIAVTAAFAKGTTRIRNIGHLREKECDRIDAMASQLKKMGIDTAQGEDWLTITGGSPKGAVINTFNDHRIAMAFAVAGLKVPGCRSKIRGVWANPFPGSGMCTMPCNLVLIGYRCCGKTTVGQHLAQLLSWKFIDTDQVIEARFNTRIDTLVADRGWAFFREAETRVLETVICQKKSGDRHGRRPGAG
jgi:hypothetical protein